MTTSSERINESLGEDVLQRTDDEAYDETHQINIDTIHLPFEVTRTCVGCGSEKTHVYFGRLPIEQWIDILSKDATTPFVCKSCREHVGDEAVQTAD